MERRSHTSPLVLDAVAAALRAPRLADCRIMVLDTDQSVLEGPKGRLLRFIVTPTSQQALSHVIDQVLTQNASGGTELVFVGGSSEAWDVIARGLPTLRMNAFFIHHVQDDGSVSTLPAKRGHVLGEVMQDIRPISHRQEQELYAKAAFDQARAHDEQRERLFFYREIKGKKSPVTFALLAALVLMFLLQLAWSKDVVGALGLREQSTQLEQYWLVLAVSMGALWKPSVMDGELWRAVSAGFLHFNLMHIAANSFVLYVLGTQMERVLGSARFVVIYTVALLGGSLASAFLTEGVALGASGAIWGLLGAQVALAYGRPPVLPPSVARTMKPMAIQNLMLNVAISFVPGIDWAAHFGGGLAGGLLLASGVLYPSSTVSSAPGAVEVGVRWLARGAVVLLALGVSLALVFGQPWRLADALGL